MASKLLFRKNIKSIKNLKPCFVPIVRLATLQSNAKWYKLAFKIFC